MNMPICRECKKKADEIQSAVAQSKIEEMTVKEFIREEEGTYERFTNSFLCDDCYIELGCPLGNKFAGTIKLD